MFEAYLTVGLIIAIVLAAVVYLSVKSYGEPNAGMWAAGTFLLWIIVFPLYLVHRAKTPTTKLEATPRVRFKTKCSCGHEIDTIAKLDESLECSQCGHLFEAEGERVHEKTLDLELGKHCKFCTDFMPAIESFCPSCRKAQR